MSEDSSLENVGGLNTQLVLVLGVAALIILVLMVAGTRSIGKVSMVCIPLCFMLMVTLVIRLANNVFCDCVLSLICNLLIKSLPG